MENRRIFRIQFSDDKITFIKSDTSTKPALFKKDGIKLELTIGRIFHKALNKTRVEGIFEKNDFEFLGTILFKVLSLFDQEDARNFVYNELALIIRDSLRGIIVLDFDNHAQDLAILPWEYLQIKQNKTKRIDAFYIGAHRGEQFDLVRFIEPEELLPKLPQGDCDKLTIVKVMCNPINDPIDIHEFENALEKLEEKYKKKDGTSRIETWRIEDISLGAYLTEIKDTVKTIDGPYILHFYGHARMDKEEAHIAFINEEGNKQWVPLDTFLSFFGSEQQYQQPLMVVFQACESGQITSNGNGFGPGLIKKGIPFILGMQNEVTSNASIAFFKTFYEALLAGEDIFTATTKGRVFLGCTYEKKNPDHPLEHYNNNSFGTPVLFTATLQPTYLFEKKKTVQESDVAEKIRKCPLCQERYPYDTHRDMCNKGRCRGRLEIVSSQAANASAPASTHVLPPSEK